MTLLICLGVSPAFGQEWANKMFKARTHNFGDVARGSKAEYAFEFQNLYKETIHVSHVRSSCGCTTAIISNRTLKTWEKGSITAKFNTRSFLGSKGATLTVVIDQPYYAEVQLTVRGYIRSDVVFDPGEINFGEVDQSDPSEQLVRVNYAGRPNWRIVDVRSANPHFEVELTETRRSSGRVGYNMLVRLTSDAPAGDVFDQLSIITDDSRRKSIPLAVHGRVVSPLTVSPASIFLGVLKPGQSVTKQLIVRGKQPFKVLEINCEDGCFEFKPPSEEKKTLHFIPLTFTAGEDPGKISQTIHIETDLGTGLVTSCVATATVRETQGEG
jgi:hypothetical protein